MQKILILFICLQFLIPVQAQQLPVLHPELSGTFLCGKEEQLIWEKALNDLSEINSGELSYASLNAERQELVDSLEQGYGPVTEGAGCSWYCGGGPYKITSGSHLEDHGRINYLPENIHDFNLFTAWVPAGSNHKPGDKINFHFKPFSPRVTEINVWNGYQKNRQLWKENGRVARFRLLINGKPSYFLEMKDDAAKQSFRIPPQQSTDSTRDLILTLEIIETFPGNKYPDVAISEVNFSGMDVHCFAAGTMIRMADGCEKPIEDIRAGDVIQSGYSVHHSSFPAIVKKQINTIHTGLVTLAFRDRKIVTTRDHPFMTARKGWASLDPEKSNREYQQETKVNQLIPGDEVCVVSENKLLELLEVIPVEGAFNTFTLLLANGDYFIANGIMVKTEVLMESEQ